MLFRKTNPIQQNRSFYRKSTANTMRRLVEMCGLESNADMYQAQDYLKAGDSCLELGGGYGRVIDYLLSLDPLMKISTIEYSEPLAENLRSKYGDTVKVIDGDWTKLDATFTKDTFDLITWMWGSIIDCPPAKRLKLLKFLYKYLNKGGKFLIDAPCANSHQWESRKTAILQYMQESVGDSYNFAVPSVAEMFYYQKKANYSELELREYTVSHLNAIGKSVTSDRILFVFHK